jgi:hypothetical protein
VVYGREPPSVHAYTVGEERLSVVQQQLTKRDKFLMEIKDRLEQAQQYKLYYDRKHREVEFQVGQWVWLRRMNCPMASLEIKGHGKLWPKFVGPFKVLERIGEVIYRLQLPASAKLHDVFHVGLLKAYCGDELSASGTLPPVRHGRACLEPSGVIKGRVARGRLELLVSWSRQAALEATWMAAGEFRTLDPSF